MCNSECDHCFVYSSPRAKGTFTLSQIKDILNEVKKIGTIEMIFFEGGEPFLFYPVMLEGIRIARSMEFKTGIVTNAYFAKSREDVELWLKPLLESGISKISISDDLFHCEDEKDNPAKRLLDVAGRLGIPTSSLCTDKPRVEISKDEKHKKGTPVVGGSTLFRGRAVENLVEGLPKRDWEEFTECPYEDLREPGRVHVDSYGNIHLCQGVSIGNFWKTPLSILIKNYKPDLHPISGPLLKGGPACLAREYNVKHDDKYVDACHFCYLTRLALIDRFPEYLAPRQVYGLE